MPLPVGTWKINLNGTEASFTITGVDPDGNVSGSLPLLFSDGIAGFWDETSQELTLAPLPLTEGEHRTILPMIFKGYLLSTPSSPRPGQDVVYTLTGYYQEIVLDPNPSGPRDVSSRRNIFGWFAQITVIN